MLGLLILTVMGWWLRRRQKEGRKKQEKVHELSSDGAHVKELLGDSPEMSELSAERRVSELAAHRGVSNACALD